MAGRLDGKVCVITGAGGGMGREAATVFTGEGAEVCVADVAATAAEETVSALPRRVGVRVHPRCRRRGRGESDDGRRPPSASAASTSSTTTPASHPTTTRRSSTRPSTAWQRVQDVNTKGVFLCCKHGIPHLLARGGGSVINVASFVAILGAATSQISYTASKGAVLSMSRELGGAVRPARACASTRFVPARSRRRCCSTSTAATRRPTSAARSTGRWAGSEDRGRSSTRRCSWRATSRRS